MGTRRSALSTIDGRFTVQAGSRKKDPESRRKSLYRRICEQEPARPTTLQESLDKGLEAIVLKCLQKDQRDRFETAEKLADELDRWLRGAPILTRPDGRLKKVRRQIRRRPVAASLLLVAVIGVLATPQAFRQEIVNSVAYVQAAIIHFLHPDRELWKIEKTLVDEKSVELVGQTGFPNWHRWLLNPGTASLDRDQCFKLQSWDGTLVALAKDIPSRHYAIQAQVKQLTGDRLGEVGLFFGYSQETNGSETVHSYLQITFNDMIKTSRKPNRPNGVDLEPHLVVVRGPGKIAHWGCSGVTARILNNPEWLNGVTERGTMYGLKWMAIKCGQLSINIESDRFQ